MTKLGNRFELVIWDEVHHVPGDIRGDASRMCAAPFRLGLTATPPQGARLSNLIDLAGPPIFQQHIDDATGDSLAEYEIVECPVEMTDEEREEYVRLGKVVSTFFVERRKTKPGYSFENLSADAARDQEAKKVLRARHRRLALEAGAEAKMRVLEGLFLLHPTAPTIIWAATSEVAREVSRQFLIPCILGHSGKDERMWILDGFQSGKFKAIVSCKLLTEGVDCPTAKVGISLGGSASETEAKQKLGRILRKTGNVRAVFYEVFCEGADRARSKARRKGMGAGNLEVRKPS